MATFLLFVTYIAFIGLGIPDSIFGAAWPAIYPEMELPVSLAGYITTFGCVFSVISSLMSGWLIQKMGTGMVALLSTAATAAGLLGFCFADSALWFFLLNIPMGLGAGAIDAALNNYVALHCKAIHMNFLHCFYGIGVTVSPAFISFALTHLGAWQNGYFLAFVLQAVITIFAVISLPLWKKADAVDAADEAGETRSLSFRELCRMPAVRTIWLVFVGSCSMEYVCGVYAGTFLVSARGMTPETGAAAVTAFYGGMALGRFLSGLLSARLHSWKIIKIGSGIVFAAILLLFVPNTAASCAALFLMGLGNGPLYPSLTHLTPENFGRDISASVMGSQMASAYIGIMAMPVLFGSTAQRLGMEIFPIFMILMYAVMIFAMMRVLNLLKNSAGRVIH